MTLAESLNNAILMTKDSIKDIRLFIKNGNCHHKTYFCHTKEHDKECVFISVCPKTIRTQDWKPAVQLAKKILKLHAIKEILSK